MLNNDSFSQPDPARSTWEQRVAAALRGLRYGSVEIVVHDGRVVQIERREKWRMDQEPARSGSRSTSSVG